MNLPENYKSLRVSFIGEENLTFDSFREQVIQFYKQERFGEKGGAAV